jgi:hypothetical protein
MMAVKSEIVDINLTGEEVQNILMDHVYSKYPELMDSVKWSWEDFSLNFNSQKLEDKALNIIFIRHSDYNSANQQTELNFLNANEAQTNG